jgi:hypothetical protein
LELFISKPASAQIRTEEISVYVGLIDELLKENSDNSNPIILTTTRSLSQSLLTVKTKKISKLLPAATTSVISDFLDVGEKVQHFKIPRTVTSPSKRLFTLSEKSYLQLFDESIKLQERWKNFKRQFPKSQSLITFSRVGIDKEKKQALVLLSTSSSGQYGAGDLFLLSKESGHWKILQQVNIWIT